MRRSRDFSAVVRTGKPLRVGHLVLHQLRDDTAEPPRVGLVVARAVGNSVVRHRVSRRIRAQLALRLEALPCGSATVVRATPSAGQASSADLGRDLDAGLGRLDRRSVRSSVASPGAGQAK